MADLRLYKTADLEAELKKRREAIKNEPQQLPDDADVPLGTVRRRCAKIVRQKTLHGYNPDDQAARDVLNAVMHALYGYGIHEYFGR